MQSTYQTAAEPWEVSSPQLGETNPRRNQLTVIEPRDIVHFRRGAWCSWPNTRPCQGRDRGFESRRSRLRQTEKVVVIRLGPNGHNLLLVYEYL